MRVRLPNLSSTAGGPIWQSEGGPHCYPETYPNPSIHHSDFLHHSLPPIASFKAKTSAYISRLPISSVQVTGPIHDPFDPPRRRNVTRRANLESGVGAMNVKSNYQQDYTRKEADRSVSYKPVEIALKSDAPFVAGSLYRSQYKPWDPVPLSAPQLSKPSAPSPPTERPPKQSPNLRPFVAETSYSVAFKQPTRGASATKHSERHWRTAVPGDDLDKSRVQPLGPFDGCSVYRKDFLPKAGERPKVLQNLSALTYDSAQRPPSRVQAFVEHADHMFYNTR